MLDGKEKNYFYPRYAADERWEGQISLKAVNMTVARLLSECAAAVKGHKPHARSQAVAAAATGPATAAGQPAGLPACKISLAHAWRISLVRADVWVSEGKLDAGVPQRVRSQLLHLYCRRQGQHTPRLDRALFSNQLVSRLEEADRYYQ